MSNDAVPTKHLVTCATCGHVHGPCIDLCNTIVTNEGEPHYCGKEAEFQVLWSDRSVKCCAAHLEQVKDGAARDNAHDRTNNPYVKRL